MLRFENTTDFVESVITRADHSSETVVGLGVLSPRLCDGHITTGSGCHYIVGYFYNYEMHFYDHFMIATAYADVSSAELVIRRLRRVTDLFYYRGGR